MCFLFVCFLFVFFFWGGGRESGLKSALNLSRTYHRLQVGFGVVYAGVCGCRCGELIWTCPVIGLAPDTSLPRSNHYAGTVWCVPYGMYGVYGMVSTVGTFFTYMGIQNTCSCLPVGCYTLT